MHIGRVCMHIRSSVHAQRSSVHAHKSYISKSRVCMHTRVVLKVECACTQELYFDKSSVQAHKR